MTELLASFHYARSVLRRALLEAGQFAHVSAGEFDRFLPRTADCTKMLVADEGTYRVYAYIARNVFDDVERVHGCLCAMCLTPVLSGDDVGGVGRLPSYIDGHGVRGAHKHMLHAKCTYAYQVLLRLSCQRTDEELASSRVADEAAFLLKSSKNTDTGFWGWLRTRPATPLRFDPRDADNRQKRYHDLRGSTWEVEDVHSFTPYSQSVRIRRKEEDIEMRETMERAEAMFFGDPQSTGQSSLAAT